MPRTQGSPRSCDFISSVAWLHVLTSSIVTKLNLHDNPCSKRDMRATNQLAQFGWGLLKSIYRYGKVLTRRMCLIIKSSLVCWSFPPLLLPSCLIQVWFCDEKLDASHLHGSKCKEKTFDEAITTWSYQLHS